MQYWALSCLLVFMSLMQKLTYRQAKVGCYAVSRAVSYELSPTHLGVSIKGGAETAVHPVRNIIFYDNNWSQTKLSVWYGVLVLRIAADRVLLASLSSRAVCNSLVNDIFRQPTTSQRMTMRFVLRWTEISTYTTRLISKENWMTFIAPHLSSPCFPYSTSIVSSVSRRSHVMSRAHG